jgi:AraC-like DNA-binding protein
MKSIKLGNTFRNYTISYVGIALLSCAMIGLGLFSAFVNKLTEVEKGEQYNKLKLAADYLEDQQQLMADISYTIQNTIYYLPTYIAGKKYKEILMLEDFGSYKNYVPLSKEYFMFYQDSNYIYKPTSGNRFDSYMQYDLNIFNSQAIYDELNSVTSFTIICTEENEDILFMAFPLNIINKNPQGDATLCFVVKKEDIFEAFKNSVGVINGNIHIYWEKINIASSHENWQDDVPIYETVNQYDENILEAYSSDGTFLFYIEMSKTGVYDRLVDFRRVSIILIIMTIVGMIVLAILVAYRSYRPINSLIKQYEKVFPSEAKCKNEIKQIAAMLEAAKKGSQKSSQQLNMELERLEDQRLLIKKQLIRLLMSGNTDENTSKNLKYIGASFSNPYYCVFVIKLGLEQASDKERLWKMIEDLSDDLIVFNIINLKYQNSFAILIIMRYKSLEYNAFDLIDAVANENGLNIKISIGGVCDDIKKIPISFMDAFSNRGNIRIVSEELECIEENNLLYNNMILRQIISEIENANSERAVFLVNQLLEQIGNDFESLIMQRCILFDIINSFIRICHKKNIDIPPDEIGSLLFLQDNEVFEKEVSELVNMMCIRIQENSNHHEKELQNKIIKYINDHATDYDMSLTKLSDEFNIHENKISRIIRKATNISYKEYLTSIRISRACELLIKSDISITKISEMVGFGNVSYFIRIFKNTTGLTPVNYKRTMLIEDGNTDKNSSTYFDYL